MPRPYQRVLAAKPGEPALTAVHAPSFIVGILLGFAVTVGALELARAIAEPPAPRATLDTLAVGPRDTSGAFARQTPAPPPDTAAAFIDAPPDAGAYRIPVEGVQAADLVDTYTQARSEGRVHNAIDIIAPRGAPVVAARSGEVLRLFTSEKGGLTLYQLAPDGRTVLYYAHLDRYAPGLAAGAKVRQGQVLGYVGDTGNATPGNYHLHFAVWETDDPKNFWDGRQINPYPLLRGAP